MFATSGDFLNMSLGIGFLVLVIFLCMFLFYGILVLRDVSKIADEVEEIVAKVHMSIVEPLKAIEYVLEKVRPYIEMVLERKIKGKK